MTIATTQNTSGLGNKILFNARERSGKFELIFPFNKSSEDLSIAINKCQGSSMSGPNYMKMIIQEIKKWECEYLDYISKQYKC
jgi:hypothetical protein